MSTASNGRAREHRVMKLMERNGWLMVMRSAASKGCADFLALHPFYGGALVQVGTAKSKTIGPADRERFVSIAEQLGCLALLATSGPGIATRFYSVTRETASHWKDYDIS